MYSTQSSSSESPEGKDPDEETPDEGQQEKGLSTKTWKRLRRPYDDFGGTDTVSCTLFEFRMPDGTLKALTVVIPKYRVLAGRLDAVVGPGAWSLRLGRESEGTGAVETLCTLRIGAAERTGLAHLPSRHDATNYAFFDAARRFGVAPSEVPTYRVATPRLSHVKNVLIEE